MIGTKIRADLTLADHEWRTSQGVINGNGKG